MRDPTFQTLFPIFINHYQSMFRVHDLSGEELIASLFDMSRLKNSFDDQPLTDLEAILFQDIEPYPTGNEAVGS